MTQKSGIEQIWSLRLAEVTEALRGNNFKVDILENLEEAVAFFKDELLPFLNPETVGVAGSETVTHSGVYQVLQESSGITFLNPYEKDLEPDARGKILRAIFSADLLITSTNALTRGGHLLNLDGLGNRVSAMIFGPAKVLCLWGGTRFARTSMRRWPGLPSCPPRPTISVWQGPTPASEQANAWTANPRSAYATHGH